MLRLQKKYTNSFLEKRQVCIRLTIIFKPNEDAQLLLMFPPHPGIEIRQKRYGLTDHGR